MIPKTCSTFARTDDFSLVFVQIDDIAYFIPTTREIVCAEAGPEPYGFKNDFISTAIPEVPIARNQIILPHGKGDVGHDMVFQFPWELSWAYRRPHPPHPKGIVTSTSSIQALSPGYMVPRYPFFSVFLRATCSPRHRYYSNVRAVCGYVSVKQSRTKIYVSQKE